jgi:hypothetical protein
MHHLVSMITQLQRYKANGGHNTNQHENIINTRSDHRLYQHDMANAKAICHDANGYGVYEVMAVGAEVDPHGFQHKREGGAQATAICHEQESTSQSR